MLSALQLDVFEQCVPRRAALLMAAGIWVAGFALAGGTAWRLNQQTVRRNEVSGLASVIAATRTEPADDAAESAEAVVMPLDVVVGLRTPRIGVTLIQKPLPRSAHSTSEGSRGAAQEPQ